MIRSAVMSTCVLLSFSLLMAAPIFLNDFDDGNMKPYMRITACADKQGACDCGEGRSVKHSTRHTRCGSGALYLRLKPCHEKADITMNYPGPNRDNWIGFSVFFPKNTPSDLNCVLWQLHDTNERDQCPGIRPQGPLKFGISHSKTHVHMRTKRPGQNCNQYTILTVKYSLKKMLGVWTDFVVNIRSSTGSDGYLVIWMGQANTKPVKALDYKGITFTYNGNGPAYRFGPYTGNPRGSGSTWEMWFDEYRFGTGVGFDAVAPGCDRTSAGSSGATPVKNRNGATLFSPVYAIRTDGITGIFRETTHIRNGTMIAVTVLGRPVHGNPAAEQGPGIVLTRCIRGISFPFHSRRQ